MPRSSTTSAGDRRAAPTSNAPRRRVWWTSTTLRDGSSRRSSAHRRRLSGPGAVSRSDAPLAQWFWVSWDMDPASAGPTTTPSAALLSRGGQRRARRPSDPRPRLLTALLDEDNEYRELFKRIWVDVMNHALTPAFLDERFEHYFAEARAPRSPRPRLPDAAQGVPPASSDGRVENRHRLAADRARRRLPHRGHARRGGDRWPARRTGLAGVRTSPACASRCRCHRS